MNSTNEIMEPERSRLSWSRNKRVKSVDLRSQKDHNSYGSAGTGNGS